MSVLQSRSRRAGIALPLALAAAAAALLLGGPGGPPAGSAGDRYRAGEAATERTSLPAGASADVRARALAHARALGIPAGRRVRLARVADRFAGTTYDEVVTLDARGHRLGIIRLSADGRPVAAVRLGWRGTGGRAIGADAARERATGLARAAGLAVGGTGTIGRTADGGWRVSWPRVVDGVPARGDGATITLFAEGAFHALATRERALAPAPAATIGRPDAARIARERLATLIGAAARDAATISAPSLAWVAPNDTFDASRPDAPDPVLRLAWVVQARTSGPIAERLRALELYLDAGDGALLGGDLLQ